MFETIGPVFFRALRRAAERQPDLDCSCIEALEAAARNADAAAIAKAQSALSALDPQTMAGLMADAHKLLREDPQQVLRNWGAAGEAH
ncbi:MAG: hypothetical protein KGI75_22835 [Rhizobiaceae bacterium]|nr:hypothetical protein [Rhizobiaceae bacterium]